MRKVDNGEKKRKKKDKNGVFSGHYVIASSLPPERLCPNDDRWKAACSCQNSQSHCRFEKMCGFITGLCDVFKNILVLESVSKDVQSGNCS